MPSPTHKADPAEIAQRILVLRGQRVLLIADLADLYGVTPKRLSEQFRRNRARFPTDFSFYIEINELRNLMPQIAASSWGGHRGRTIAFTEHGAIMAATVEKSVAALDAGTKKQFEEVYRAIRALMAPAAPKSRPIGFTADYVLDSICRQEHILEWRGSSSLSTNSWPGS